MIAREAAGRIWKGLLVACASAAFAACSPAPAPEAEAAASVAEPAAPSPGRAESPVERASSQGGTDRHYAVAVSLAPDRPLRAGDYVWEPDGVPPGPLRIVVDLEAETLYVYRAGVEMGRAHIIYGDDDKPTPTGTFPILQKNADHVSNLYDAEMPYMLRLTWDGIAIHGSVVDDLYATHGCIGIPDDFAALLFAEAKLGDVVTVTNGWRASEPASAAGDGFSPPLGQATPPTT